MGYKTIYEKAQASFIEKKSEFIGYIAPVKTNEEAIEFINSIKALNRKATHNVYAYILRQDNITRYSDDGEPQGTAGVPVLDVLQKEGLTDVCVVVTRYFGGILLGGGGLVRAYSHACKIAVDAAKIMDMHNCYELLIKTDYNFYGKINYILPDFDVKILSTEFTDDVTVKLLVKSELCENLIDEITETTNGKIYISKSNEKFADFS
jgi:uncharacterized YigZ family protein